MRSSVDDGPMIDFNAAMARLKNVVSKTPLEYNSRLSRKYKANIYLKREDLQEVRSYKLRGAFNMMSSIEPGRLKKGVVCASAGNHAQGFAYSCKKLGVKGVVFMPVTTPNQKVRQTKMFGEEFINVVLTGDTFDDCADAARRYTMENEMVFIPPFEDPRIIEGQGTVGVEILQDLPQVDYLICESTYGNRYHENREKPEDALERLVKEACEDIPGRLIIPAFSVGRTQALLYTLNKLYLEGRIKNLKVFTDSPLARASTRVYEKYVSQLNTEAREQHRDGEPLFDFENLIYLKTTKESQELSFHTEPCIIVSSSGMVQGGRVEYHVAENIENQYATILFIGYTTEGTLGARLRDKDLKELRIKGVNKEVKARIVSTDVFSGHADLEELLHFVQAQQPAKLKKLILVHGEYDSMLNFKSVLEKQGFENIEIPQWGQTIEL